MKTLVAMLLLLNVASVMALTLSAKPELQFNKQVFDDGTVEFDDVRIILAGRTFYLSTYFDKYGIDTNRNDLSFCKSQGYSQTIYVLNEIDYTSQPLTFSTRGSIDDSIYLHPKDNSYRYSKVFCTNKINPKLEFNH